MTTIAVCNGTARTSKYITELALDKGYKVKAFVRSPERFWTQNEKHKNLTSHAWSNLDDIGALAELLKDVSTIFIALGHITTGPIHINEDCVQSICAALHQNQPKRGKSPTKIVLLSSLACSPYTESEVSPFQRWIMNVLLGNQYADLRRTQSYLRKQEAWLQYTIVAACGIVDVEDAAAYEKSGVRLVQGDSTHWDGVISYKRLAASMFNIGEESGDEYNSRYITPLSTSKVRTKFRDFESARELFRNLLVNRVIPYLCRSAVFAMVFAGMGYYARMKQQMA